MRCSRMIGFDLPAGVSRKIDTRGGFEMFRSMHRSDGADSQDTLILDFARPTGILRAIRPVIPTAPTTLIFQKDLIHCGTADVPE